MDSQAIADEKGRATRCIDNRPLVLRSNRMCQLKVSTKGVGQPDLTRCPTFRFKEFR